MSDSVKIQIELFDGAVAPEYAREGDAGVDLRSTEDFVIEPGDRALVPTGIRMAIPYGYVGLVHPRSGLALNYGITVLNTPGTIDSGYRGEIGVILMNTSKREFYLRRGDKIAQLVIQKVETAEFEVVDALTVDDTDRGTGGFGSTGI